MRLRGFRRVVVAVSGVAVVAGGLTLIAPPPVEADTLPDPEVWAAPAEVNRIPVGDVPEGEWSSGESGPGTDGRASASVVDDGVAAPGLGVQGHYGFEEFVITERLSAAVNLGNGNLVVRAADVAINGPEIGLALDRFYNSASVRAGAFGPAWSISAGQDVGLEVGPGSVVFRAPSGFRAAFTEDGGDWVGPPGLNADLTELSGGGWQVTYRATDETLTFTAGGYLLSSEGQNGNSLDYAYNTNNTVASVTDAAGRVTEFDYDSGTLATIEDPAGRITEYSYDGANRLISAQAPDGSLVSYTYNSLSKLASIETDEGTRVEFTYTSAGQVSQVSRIDATTEDEISSAGFAYASGVTTLIDADDGEWVYTIDSQGRVEATTDPLERTRSQAWTANSSLESSTDAMGAGGVGGNVTTYSYDEANNPTAVTLPTGAAAQATYTTDGSCGSISQGHPYRVKCATDPAGNETTVDYDDAGNVLAVRDTTSTGGREITYTYQGTDSEDCGAYPGQRCSATNGEGHTTTFGYDADGNIDEITPPAPLGATSYTFDSLGRLASLTDGAGVEWTYEYDVMDRLTRQRISDEREVITTYDADGRRTSETTVVPAPTDPMMAPMFTPLRTGATNVDDDPVGITLEWTYDARGLVTSMEMAPYVLTSALTYDSRGNLITLTDNQGTVTYDYDEANQVTTIIEPGGSCATGGQEGPGIGCISMAYDNNGNETQRTYPGGSQVETTFDGANRPVRIQALDANSAISADFAYSYTDANDEDQALIQSRIDHAGIDAPINSVITYAYDSLNRLVEAIEQNPSGVITEEWSYAYDDNGNRTEADDTTYAYNAADQITEIDGEPTPATYNDAGDMTTTPDGTEYRYNDTGQLEAGETADGDQFANAYLGVTNANRVLTFSVAEDLSLYQPTPLGWSNRQDPWNDEDTQTVTRHPNGDAVAVHDDANSTYIATDVLGSPTVHFNDTGDEMSTIAYDPYGTLTYSSADRGIFGYAGGEDDDHAGLTKFGARYYNPELGSFTQIDPSGLENSPYLYAAANPINFIDPTGLMSCSAIVGLTGLLHAAMWGAIIGSAFGVGPGTIVGLVYGLGWWAVANFLCED